MSSDGDANVSTFTAPDGSELSVLHNADGVPLGFLTEADDGSLILHDGRGTVLSAVGADGGAVDAEDYSVEAQGDEPGATFEEPAYEEAEHPDVNWDELGHQLEDVTRVLGRQLTSAEQQGIAAGLERQAQQGQPVSVPEALDLAYVTGTAESPDMDTNGGRIDYMVDRLAQLGAANAETPAGVEFDPDTHEGRSGYMAARLNGADAQFIDGSAEPSAEVEA